MEIIRSPARMAVWADAARAAGKTICLVPTMGFFHEGHLSLMRRAAELADEVVVSLFVNPIQFGLGEDLDRYPRNFERDAALAEQNGISVLFSPENSDVYPSDFATLVEVRGLTETLCGASRPGHFIGVTTVVAKLFHMTKPHSAVFGEKDFQQLAVIRKMVADLNWDVSIIAHPIVREPDGLAMSSRNSYLTPEQRRRALALSASLALARRRVREGERSVERLSCEVRDFLLAGGGLEIDYVALVDSGTLTPCKAIDQTTLLALAVKIGVTRLIDNALLMG